ncbi:MAG: penicillin-binding protein activator [Porticoccaceae bacterium]|nr:penicillin-binding protein activator [Porticoccaceae bacterium]
MDKKFLLQIVGLGCILAFISGCTPTTTTQSGSVPVAFIATTEDASLYEQAETLFVRAQSVEVPSEILLQAAILFAKSGDKNRTVESLALIDPDELKNVDFISYTLLGIELNLQSASPAEALLKLQATRFIALKSSFKRQDVLHILSLESDISAKLGNIESSINASIQLAQLLNKKSDVLNVHNKIWRQLSAQPYNVLQQCFNEAEPILGLWCNLAADMRLFQSNHPGQLTQFNTWKTANFSHPAARTPPSGLKQNWKNTSSSQVALLLPLQDDYRIPSQTFLDGFMAAYYQLFEQSNTEPPNIRLHDTSNQTMQQAYENAIAEGAEMVIGGLRESEAESLMQLQLMPVPTISLNRLDRVDTQQPVNLVQFGNSPEDEMTQIADLAWRNGHRNAIVIAPDNNWGVQATRSFDTYWKQKGGQLLGQVSYPMTVKDFTQFLKPSLQIDLSEDRGVQLKRFVNSRLIYTPRRRQDIDFIVALGYPLNARQIKPALEFLYAADLPVYSISKIYNGVEQAGLDRDLSGIQFTAMPWTLPGQLVNELRSDETMHTAYRQLYALGYDTFLVHRNLDKLSSATQSPLFGAMGVLSLSQGVIKRTGRWGEFNQGKVAEVIP